MVFKKLSVYFLEKTSTKEFSDELNELIERNKDKKVILYGAGLGFEYLYKRYPFNKMNIVAIADKKFQKETKFMGFNAISPEAIVTKDYDLIIITNEQSDPIINYLYIEFNIDVSKLKPIFKYEVDHEYSSVRYLNKYKFKETLDNLIKSLSGKSVVVYGADPFFEAMKKNYDIDKLNIVGITDNEIKRHRQNEKLYDYPVLTINEAIKLNPDYIMVAKPRYVDECFDIYRKYFRKTKIKIKPFIKKSLWALIREV